jgi:hypothetical protein
MKAPLKSKFTMVVNLEQMTDAVKKDFGDEVRYVRANLGEPFQQDGQFFSFLIAPFKLIGGKRFQQKGPGVLCQTESEAKETFENLDKRSRKHLVVVQWAGDGVVGWLTNCRRYALEIRFLSKNLPSGKKLWIAYERETDQDTLEVKVVRRKDVESEGEARFWANKWLAEAEEKKKKYSDSADKNIIPPPPRGIPLTNSDLQDLGNAKLTALKKQWPHCFKIFDQKKSAPNTKIPDREVEDAYLLDLVRNGGEASLRSAKDGKVRADMHLISALHKAAQNYSKRGKSKIIDTAIYLIAFKWELGWCYLSDEQLAKNLSEILEKS